MVGQLSMAIGVLLTVFAKDGTPISFVSGLFIGLSLFFHFAFGLGLRKDRTS